MRQRICGRIVGPPKYYRFAVAPPNFFIEGIAIGMIVSAILLCIADAL